MKYQVFRAFCDSLDPAGDLARKLRTVKFLASRSVSSYSNVISDPDSPVIRELREELVRTDVLPVDVESMWDVDKAVPMNNGFSWEEFSAALSSCTAKPSPRINGVKYMIIISLIWCTVCQKALFKIARNFRFQRILMYFLLRHNL